MVDALVHRGPDGVGVDVAGGMGLGHRRLKVIDLSEAAAQPIWLPDRSLGMVYNGEVHNYPELAAELRAAGLPLRADNDTEVLLWAYRLWGEDCFERLNGMWAAAFWQPAEGRLVLSRDRFGIKPLVYSTRGPRIAFASEAKALLAAFPEERRPDRDMLLGFVGGRVSDPDAGEHTFFDNIRSLPPGHVLRIERAREVLRQYWTFKPGSETARPDAPEAFLALLNDAVKVRLRTDVPFGILLSGGLDSSTVARLAAGETPHALQCFSLYYPANPLDESRYVRLVADDPSRYQIHWITPSTEDLLATIGAIVWHHDAPTPMRGRYPQWHVLKEASRHVTVVLGGQGADELLAGYDRFVLPFARDRLDPHLSNPRSRWALIGELLQLGRVSAGIHRVMPPLVLAALIRELRKAKAALAPDGRVAGRSAPHGLTPGGLSTAATSRPYRSKLNNALWGELRSAGLPEILHAEDALSMAFSLESRLPFLDHRVVEFCFSLAYHEKIGQGWTKLLLRRATPGILPDAVRLRRHKLGFPGDYPKWLGEGAGLDAVRQLLLDPVTLQRGWLDRNWLTRRFAGPRRRAERWILNNPQQTWRSVTVELWCRQFLDSDHSLRPPTRVMTSRPSLAALRP